MQEYLTDKEPLFSVESNETDAYLENNAIHRAIADRLIEKNVLVFHGSALCMDGSAYIFVAKSGTGKSTHARLWRELYGDHVWMINDDKPMVRIDEDCIMVYGTPWNGKHGLGNNSSAPLKAIVELEQSEKNRIVPIDHVESLLVLLKYAYTSKDSTVMEKLMNIERYLLENVGFYKLSCNMELDAARIAKEGIN